MADKGDNYVDRKETYLSSPKKGKVTKGTKTHIPAHTSVTSETNTTEKKRVSSTSWQISKTTVITEEVRSGQKTSMEFEVSSSGSVSPVASPKTKSFLSSTEFGFGQKRDQVFGSNGATAGGSATHDLSDEFVFIESEEVLSADRSEGKQVSKGQETETEPKKSYFAHLLEQESSSRTSSTTEQVQKNKDDASSYERITYTPGLAIRSYAEEEMKKRNSPDRDDATNNNSHQATDRGGQSKTVRDSEDQDRDLSPAVTYRIAQIMSGEEVDLWEEERKRKERQEYAIIDSLSMDDMMKMLGEHDRMKFESQEINQESFPIFPGTLSKDLEESQVSHNGTVTETESRVISRDSKHTVHQYSETSMRTSGMSSSDARTSVSAVSSGQVSSRMDVTDSRSITMSGQSSRTLTLQGQSGVDNNSQEMKTQMMSSEDVVQRPSMGQQMDQSAMTLSGGVTRQKQSTSIVAESQSTLSRQSPPKKEQPIEVERKFNITKETESKIKKLGGKILKENSFQDVYYDNSDYKLTLADCWLRKRNNAWEMKVASENMSIHDFVTQYREITKEKEIVKLLKDMLGLKSKCSTVKEILKSTDMSEFATISTTRKSYRLLDCTVDLDLTDHGFQVGEIEVMVTSSSKVPSALKTINDVARKLALDMDTKVCGKMTDYLKRKNHHLYKLLEHRLT